MMRTYEVTITAGARLMQTWVEAGSPQKALKAAVEEDRELREALASGKATADVKAVAA